MSGAGYSLSVNGCAHRVEGAWEGESLLHVLRERLGFQGAKGGCEQGECGSCSVLVDGDLMCACLVLAAAATGSEITTLEGLQPADKHEMTAVQRALIDSGGVQCGFCTPGLVVAIHTLLAATPAPTPIEVQEALAGNLCRCTGYGRILAAVADVVASGPR